MNEMETQLSRLFNAAVGEPPNQVTPHAARRQALKRRVIACVSATAALAVAGSIGLAVAANAIAPHRASDGRPQVTMPKYYFEMDPTNPVSGGTENVVRSVATGAITGRVHCPGRSSLTLGATTDSRHTFFIACPTNSKTGNSDGTRIYRFQVSDSGRVSGFRMLPGGNLPKFRGENMTVTADGSLLAIVNEFQPEVLVINTKTGSHAVWRSDAMPGGAILYPGDVSFARGDRELAIFGSDYCVSGSVCKPVQEMRVVSPAAKGGKVSSGRQVLIKSQLVPPKRGAIADAFLGPDGKTVTATVDTYLAAGGTSPGVRVLRFSLTTGKVLRTLFNPASYKQALITHVDQSGRFVLLKVLKKRAQIPVFGWIDQGKLHLLQPLRPKVADVIAW
jgi:hypothetical protein